ncbi:MAG: glycolate oxidase subunit GlcE [Gammaproteobacteria bacterium]|nr:glycolate oxidase subunit GlcE [Gammaproteobacteria bacterium]MDH5799748.1 glycolate oxidase subunit GlcE [Gammaproteobacteria bacterium]
MEGLADKDISPDLQQRILAARGEKQNLNLCGSGSKSFYGRVATGESLPLSAHRGVVSYEPSELVLTVRAGTTLKEIDALLASQQQMLPFEPPGFGDSATIGGTLACGFSGPRRPFSGAARDFMLGCKVLTGKGEIVNFGGQVMKNVAGYDVSRLMVGAMGTLGVLLEVSLKVLPIPEDEMTLCMPLSETEAIDVMCARAAKPLPLSAACYDGESVCLRLSGSTLAVNDARKKIAGDVLGSSGFWEQVREHSHYFFSDPRPLWRISVAPATLPLPLRGQWFYDWGGGQRWLKTNDSAAIVRAAVESEGGHATLFSGKQAYADTEVEIFHPLPQHLLRLHQRLKATFDPDGILNRGRMYSAF